MAQVLVKNAAGGEWTTAATAHTINLPNALANERILIFVGVEKGATAGPATPSGWTMTARNLGGNMAIRYYRSVFANQTGQTLTLNFATAVRGQWWACAVNGLPYFPPWSTDEDYNQPQVLPSVTAQAGEALQMTVEVTADYPRSSPAISGMTEHYDDFQYLTASSGVSMFVRSRNIGAGATAQISYNMRNEGDTADLADRTMYMSFAVEAFDATEEGLLDVLAEFPSIAILLSPDLVTVEQGTVVQFTAALQGSTQGVSWTIESGTGNLTNTGVFTPQDPGTVVIRAAAVEAPTIFDESTITVLPAAPVIYPVGNGTSPRVIMGEGVPGGTVTCYIGGVSVGSDTVDINGEWQLAVVQSPGTYLVTALQTFAGLVSGASNTVEYQVFAAEPPPAPPPSGVASMGGSGRDVLMRGDGGLPAPPVSAGEPTKPPVALSSPFRTPKALPTATTKPPK